MNIIVSFIIRTKNEDADIAKTCECILAQEGYFKKEIIIVDSGSEDKTLEIARNYTDKIIEIPSESFSWGYALNVGIENANGNYVFLLSGHCFLCGNSVQNGMELLEKNGAVALYGKQLGNPHKNIYECAELEKDYPDISWEDSTTGNIIHGRSNACCLFHKCIWRNYKFNEKLQSNEDGEWYLRLTTDGLKVAYSDKVRLIHGHNLDMTYMYKKEYWREYAAKTYQQYKFNFIRGNTIYIRRMLYILKDYIDYRRFFKILKMRYKAVQLLRIAFIRNVAIMNARKDYIEGKNKDVRYEDIDVPSYIDN